MTERETRTLDYLEQRKTVDIPDQLKQATRVLAVLSLRYSGQLQFDLGDTV